MIALTDPPLSWLQAALLGLVEGLTEFLPVSSTGHLIVVQRLLGQHANAANNAFAIGIQLGAITAILLLYRQKLWQAARQLLAGDRHRNLLLQIAVAALPAIGLGVLLDDWIDAQLFHSSVVATTLVLGGALLLLLERWHKGRNAASDDLSTLSYRSALVIGCWQSAALVPGVSRAAATICGGLLVGLSRTAAAEFSFLVGLPILYGAAGYKLTIERELLSRELVAPLVVGAVVAFGSAWLVVRPFVAFLRQHTFAPFAYYRIAFGLLLAVWLAAGWLID